MNVESRMASIKVDPRDPYLYVKQAEGYLESGDEFRAREIILRRRNVPSNDPTVHLKWASLMRGTRHG